MSRKPRVLLTNDDGFWTPGIQTLGDTLREVAEVLIVAPQLEQSARGHAITMNEPIKLRKEYKDGEFIGYSVLGTPADCVKVAVRHLYEGDEPDCVFSGINHGRNTGTNTIYSGTVAGAMEGAMYNLPSAAFSLATVNNEPDFLPSAKVARGLLPLITELGLPHGIMLNVNIPQLPLDEMIGVEITRQSQFRFRDVFQRREDPRGNVYFWLDGERMVLQEKGNVDEVVVNDKKVSITPLSCDLTAHEWLETLEGLSFRKLLES